MEYGLGIDLGTTYTAAAVCVDGRPEVVRLGDHRAEMPSVVFVKSDGEVLVGDAADRQADAEPDRLAREFKRRIGDEVAVQVGGSPFSAHALTARLIEAVVAKASRDQGGPPASITVAHPANWARFKRDFLVQAVHLAGADGAELRTEPELVALQFAVGERVQPGETLTVYDLGGGTFDAAVLRRTNSSFALLGRPEGIEHLGGVDFDEAVFTHVTADLGPAFTGLDFGDEDVVADMARLRRDCVHAKENLSFDTETTIQVTLPGLRRKIRLNRSELEAKIAPTLEDTIAATRRALRSAGVEPSDLRCILLAGGSSRIPLVSQLLSTAFDRPLVVDPHPEHSVALGAALAAARTPPQPATTGPPAQPAATGTPSGSPGRADDSTDTRVAVRPAVGTAKVPTVPAQPNPPRTPPWWTAAIRHPRVRFIAGAAVVAALAATLTLTMLHSRSDRPPLQPSPSAPRPVQAWAVNAGGPVTTRAGADAAAVYVVTGSTVRAIRRTDGGTAWTYKAGAQIIGAPQVGNGAVHVASRDGRLHAIEAGTGRRRWAAAAGTRPAAAPRITVDAAYIGSEGGSLFKIDRDGEQQWRHPAGGPVSTRPVVAGNIVIGASDDAVFAVAAKNHAPLWTVNVRAVSDPAAAAGRVYVAGRDRRLHAINVRDGVEAWSFSAEASLVSDPIATDALVYVVDESGTLYAVDTRTGLERWRHTGDPGDEIGSPVVDGNVYVAGRAGRVVALDAAIGTESWVHPVDGPAVSPRFADGALYVGTATGTVYALRLPPSAAPLPSSASTSADPSPSPIPSRTPREPPPPDDPDPGDDDEPDPDPDETTDEPPPSSDPPDPPSEPPSATPAPGRFGDLDTVVAPSDAGVFG